MQIRLARNPFRQMWTRMSRSLMRRRWRVGIGFGMLLAVMLTMIEPASSSLPDPLLLMVYDHEIGVSTRYIGACEGNTGFDRADFADLNINTYRIYGGMSRWEAEDDDGNYGSPSIAQIKENPNLVNWDWWDEVMTHPNDGTDYGFSGTPEELWQGSARTIFDTLKAAQIRPVVTLRNSDPGWEPAWALQLNPPRTEADWNEWWEHVFATVYWLNVRNDYHVDDWEIHNEPDNRQQGWGGNQDDYFELMRVTEDAIAHVYNTYLPSRVYHIHAPKTLGGSNWPRATLDVAPTLFDSVNVHNYDRNVATYIQQVREWMQNSPHADAPLWIGEWGTYTTGYTDLAFSLDLIKNMIRMSQPGKSYVHGSHIFSLYDWGQDGFFQGLIDAAGDRRLSYYAFRLGIRALQGGKPVTMTALSDDRVMAIATKDDETTLQVLLVNDSEVDVPMRLDLQRVRSQGHASIREFSHEIHDEQTVDYRFNNGQLQLSMPAQAAWLLTIPEEPSDP
ncbi:hypothetical protein [Vacuolonema iberomarrocanum]|uniref:hypothetical protein n=1 Tax=Vacuolonema iberomarrocanum TaxID=3454632 RepID=UPI0019FB8270|nr:hypothetical protein [filamentous cyanobacterium LEGE 07170]